MKHWKQPLKGFLQNRFYDNLTMMLQKNSRETADYLGKNWYRTATLL